MATRAVQEQKAGVQTCKILEDDMFELLDMVDINWGWWFIIPELFPCLVAFKLNASGKCIRRFWISRGCCGSRRHLTNRQTRNGRCHYEKRLILFSYTLQRQGKQAGTSDELYLLVS
jgi:hypothetical protein